MSALDLLALTANPDRLASALRGKASTTAEKSAVPSAMAPRLLPQALAAWERDRPEREAEQLRLATTPRAMVGGEEVEHLITNVPTVEHKVTKLVADLTPSNEPTPDTGG